MLVSYENETILFLILLIQVWVRSPQIRRSLFNKKVTYSVAAKKSMLL